MQMILETSTAAEAPLNAVMNRMTRMLRTVRPASDAEALRMLRAAFPQTTLQDRIAALARYTHQTTVAHVS